MLEISHAQCTASTHFHPVYYFYYIVLGAPISSFSAHHSALAVYLLFYILLACTYLVDKIRRRTIKGFKLELLLQ